MNLSATDGLMALTSANLRNNAAGWAYSCRRRSRTTIRRSIVCTNMSKAGVQHGLFGWLESGIADIQSLSVHFRFVPKADPRNMKVSGDKRPILAFPKKMKFYRDWQ